MDETRNNRTVERKMKEALKHDRARIQVGRISHFGLLEMSRQRIRSSVLESSTEKCPVCGGSGHVRSVSSVALQLLRAIEELLIKGATHNLIVRTRTEVALYVLNHKRAHLRALEERFRISITISADPAVTGQQSYIIDRGEQVHTLEAARSLAAAALPLPVTTADLEEEPEIGEEEGAPEMAAEAETSETHAHGAREAEHDGEREGDGEPRRRRRRRGRGRGRNGEAREAPEGAPPAYTQETAAEHAVAHEDYESGTAAEAGIDEDDAHAETPEHVESEAAANGEDRDGRKRRRRGRRGGRRNRQRGEGPSPSGNGGEPASHTQHVGSDFPPVSDEDASAVSPPFEAPVAPVHEAAPPPPPQPPATPAAAVEPPPAAAEPAPAAQEPPRRRSTIREPAPIVVEGAPAPSPSPPPVIPPPTPVISSSTPEEAAAPKRGWWGKRLLGGKE
jgi:ribonuclease E